MESTEALLMDYYPVMSQAWYLSHPSGLFSGRKVGATHTPFTKSPKILYIRADNADSSCIVNVFDAKGNKVYSIERSSRYATMWTIYETSTRSQVAQVKCGVLYRNVSFTKNIELQSRSIGQRRWLYGGLPNYRFYLSDGAPLEWARDSQYLERIINPNGGHEETRQRLARVRLLRSARFDYELLVDPDFDQEVALATAFISMLTQWSTFRMITPGARTQLREAESNLD